MGTVVEAAFEWVPALARAGGAKQGALYGFLAVLEVASHVLDGRRRSRFASPSASNMKVVALVFLCLAAALCGVA